MLTCCVFFFKQKTAYEMRISDWSSDVCSSDLLDVSNLDLAVQGTVRQNKLGLPAIKNLNASVAIPELKVDRSRSEFRVQKLALRAKGDLSAQSFDVAFDAPSLAISPDSAKGEPIAGTVKLTGDEVLGVSLGLKGIGGNAQNLRSAEHTSELQSL